MPPVIHWFRRDLRLTDNTALAAAVASGQAVVPVYVLSDWKNAHSWTGPARQQFLCGSLASLARNLEAVGGRLIIRRGDAVEELRKLLEEAGASAIHTNRDPDPFGREVERKLEKMAANLGRRLHLHQDAAIHERDEVLTGQGRPFRVFTPYSKAWLKLNIPALSRSVTKLFTPPEVASLPLPTLETWGLHGSAEIIEPGERAARLRMRRFLAGPVLRYGALRNFPAGLGASRLSQDLRFGLLSPRELYSQCHQAMQQADAAGRRSIQIYVNELIWREFYLQILWHFPHVLESSFNPKYDDVPWEENEEAFQRWCEGRTGFPIVDAAMRCLRATGYMHNRLRMITAMFLTKDLHLHWRRGEQYFMHHLTDGEIASNNGGWQWSAGTGADASPYFRIQNPWTQTLKFDPEGKFIRKWLPELRAVDPARLMQPPKNGLPLAKDYPLPMVDHAREREKTLRRFRVGLGPGVS